jgi:hypothetical protein
MNTFIFLDIYVCCVSSSHHVCPSKFYVAMVSTTVETDNPEAELKPGLDILAPIEEKYVPFPYSNITIIWPENFAFSCFPFLYLYPYFNIFLFYRFLSVDDVFEPTDDGATSKVCYLAILSSILQWGAGHYLWWGWNFADPTIKK